MNIRHEIQLIQLHLEEAYNHIGIITQGLNEAEAEALVKAQAQAPQETAKAQESNENYSEEEKQEYLKWLRASRQQAAPAKPTPKYEELPDDAQELTEEEMREMQKTKRIL